MLAFRIFAAEPRFQPFMPIVKAGMMAGDDVGEHARGDSAGAAAIALEDVQRMEGAGGGVALLRACDSPLDMRVWIVGLADVALKAGSILTQVVPQTGQFGPSLGREWSSECFGECCCRAKMIFERMTALTAVRLNPKMCNGHETTNADV